MSTPRRSARTRRAGSAPPPLLGALLRLAWQQVRRHMAAEVRAAGFDDLQDAHLSVFQYPGPDGLRPSDLARHMQVSRQAMNHLLAQLESLGYIQRRAAAPDDRRRVYLTSRGRRLMAALKNAVRGFERRCQQSVGRQQFAAFVAVLRAVADR